MDHYLLKRNNIYYYDRFIPKIIRPYMPKQRVRISLQTDSLKEARKRAAIQNAKVENYWKTLIDTGETHSQKHFQQVVARSQLLGFSYYPIEELILKPIEELIERLLTANKHDLTHAHVEAICGGVPVPVIKLSDALPRFWAVTRDRLIHKTSDDQRKWRNPRLKAWRNFLSVVPDKPLNKLNRDDILVFRDWQIDRLEAGEIIAASANKDLKHMRSIVVTVAENNKIQLDETHLFKRLELQEIDSIKRPPFDHQYLISTLLNPEKLTGLTPQERGTVYAFAETGAGPSELVGLLPEDIHPFAPIPYIHIAPRVKKGLKTHARERKIPLVGHALDAFRAFPNGFTDYRGKADALSTTIGKYMRENGLYPTELHSLYSLRHNFQDRLIAAKAGDRVQADLMGHSYKAQTDREEYGAGSTLELKHEYLEKIKLKKQLSHIAVYQ